jgi:regulatory protein
MPSKPPNESSLYEAALNHLARYAATEAGLTRILARKIDRWAKLQTEDDPQTAKAAVIAAKSRIPTVISRLKSANILNDSAFAASRAKRLTREGKSRRASLAHLAAKGVASSTAAAILKDDPDRELAAACAYLRRRRAGPFGDAPEMKTLAAMARAGFTQTTARQVLRMDKDEAETRIKTLNG